MTNTKAQALAHYTEFLAQARAAADRLIHCRACGEYGPPDITCEGELVDNMNDRPATLESFEVVRCECGSEDVEDARWCELCQERPATEPGTDMCKPCYLANEAEQDATLARAKELEKELNQHFQEEHA